MKNLMLLTTSTFLLFFLSIVPVFGQNVGIGTDNPQEKLHVVDTARAIIRATSIDELGAGLELQNLGALSDWRLLNNGGNLLFQRGDVDGILSSRAVFSSDGRIGFGDTSPESDFEFHRSGPTAEMRITASNILGRPKLDLMAGIDGFATYHWRLGQHNRDFVLQYGRNEFQFDSIEVLRAEEDGSIGIGTNDPQTHVHISGPGNQALRVQSTSNGSNSDPSIDLVRGTPTGTDYRMINDGGTFKIMQNSDNFITPGNEHMRISATGNVGINQQSPGAKLHVNGNIGLSGTSGGNYFRSGSNGLYVAIDNNEIGARNSQNQPSTLYLQYWGGNLSLANNDGGRVGIGTTNPNGKVHIVDGSDVNIAGGGELVLGSTNNLNMALDGNEIQARNNGAAGTLLVQQGGGDVIFAPNENGQVGIGMQAGNLPPDEYLFAVDGKILSEEVRVELSGDWWPDYVFTESYNLMPLEELEGEIKDLGHLPGIPSATVVENEGFELGDMQRRMLEKVEELTLYMIEANKEISLLKSELKALKEK